MSIAKSLRSFCEALRGNSQPDEASIQRLYAMSLASLDTSDATGLLRERISALLDEAFDAHLGVSRTLNTGFDPVRTHTKGGRGYLSYFHRQQVAINRLEALIEQLEQPRVRNDGYTPGELMREADIGKSTWQSIARMADIGIRPGDSARRLSNTEIRRLIVGAQQYGKRKGGQAAVAWEAILQRNQ